MKRRTLTPPKTLREMKTTPDHLAKVTARYSPVTRVKAEKGKKTLNVFGYVGDYWGSANVRTLMEGIEEADGEAITVAINSPGGDFFEGVAMYNALINYEGEVETKVLGLAGSAASLIMMAGDTRLIGKTGQVFIHNSIGFTVGNKEVHQKTANDLAGFDTIMASMYSDVSGMDLDDVVDAMNAETFYDGQAAVDLGLATALYDPADDEETEEETEEVEARSAHKCCPTFSLNTTCRGLTGRALFGNFTTSSDARATLRTTTPRATLAPLWTYPLSILWARSAICPKS